MSGSRLAVYHQAHVVRLSGSFSIGALLPANPDDLQIPGYWMQSALIISLEVCVDSAYSSSGNYQGSVRRN
jgi:hypothetical protein